MAPSVRSDRGTEPRAGLLAWDPSEDDLRAEVDHVDGRRRPWRSAAAGGLTMLLGAGLVLCPPTPTGAAVALGSALLAAIAAWRFPIVRSQRDPAAASGFALEVGSASMTLWRAGLERRLAPGAVRSLAVGMDHVFLHLSEAEVVTIPCRAFGDERGGLDRFVARVERFRRSGTEPEDAPEPGCHTWSLSYDLRAVGLGGVRHRRGDLERLLLVSLSGGAFVLLLLGGEAWRGVQDLVLFALFAGLGAGMVALAGRRRTLEGPVALSVGPEGGQIQTRDGSVRFRWDRVLGVEVAYRVASLRFADRVLPVPLGAFEREEDQRTFAEDVRAWWEEARRRARQTSRSERDEKRLGPPVRPCADPFAPPWEG